MKREPYEWSNYWWDHADREGKRVLLIGDSITNGYSAIVRKHFEGLAFVDMMATSKFIFDDGLEAEIKYFLSQYAYQAIHFNNGLHGIDLPIDDYMTGYKRITELLLSKGCALCLATSTPVTVLGRPKILDPVKNTVVTQRNQIVERIAREHNLPVNDLYHAVVGKKSIRDKDGLHYNAKGYRLLGRQVADILQKNLLESEI